MSHYKLLVIYIWQVDFVLLQYIYRTVLFCSMATVVEEQTGYLIGDINIGKEDTYA